MKQSCYYYDADISSTRYLKEDPILDTFPHFHDSVEFIFIKKGSAICHLENKKKLLEVGDIFFAESYETHYYETTNDDFSAIVLVVSREYLQTFRTLYPGLSFETFLTDKEKNKEIFQIMEDWLKRGTNLQILNYTCVSALFTTLVERYPLIERDFNQGDVLLKDLLRYIHLHYLEDITVISMAHELGYSPEYCSKVLKKVLKNGVRAYINSLRLKKANELMNDKSLNLSQLEILYQCGFTNPSTYYRVKKQFENNDFSMEE